MRCFMRVGTKGPRVLLPSSCSAAHCRDLGQYHGVAVLLVSLQALTHVLPGVSILRVSHTQCVCGCVQAVSHGIPQARASDGCSHLWAWHPENTTPQKPGLSTMRYTVQWRRPLQPGCACADPRALRSVLIQGCNLAFPGANGTF